MNYTISNLQKIGDSKGIFNNAGISKREIPVKLMFYYQEGIGTKMVWELSIQEINSSDWWNFRVDASTGQIIDKDNWTISCNVLGNHEDHNHDAPSEIIEKESLFYTVENNPAILVGSYNVYAVPVESPNHGGRTNVSNPDDATASPYGWHDTNGSSGAEYTITRGNNAHAYEDGDNAGFSPDGGAGLNFNFTINTNYSAGDQSESDAITNLFYWNNIIHDVMYQHGFDEASGNFQENNYGNGGAGSDYVYAEAQDGSGTCNANFGTPSDGSNPTMQMYVCGSRDGDLDNGVIIHEYGHGISNRLTGGPAASSCLNNTEQMGEGWSDYIGMVMTIESGDAGVDSRGMGTWLIGEGAGGAGIRTYPYSTNFAVNPHTYDDIKTEAIPHGIGSVWAMMLWEMTWDLIAVYGVDSDIYGGSGGNNVALTLVTEGMKLQPCSPGFIDGRDAILAADIALYGGANACTIWEAFAKRGLGFSADQGSSGSATDGTEAFDLPPNTVIFETTLDTTCETQGIQTGLSGGSPAGGVYSGDGVSDKGDGTFDFDPTVGGLGNTIVTYTVFDACSGAVVDIDDTIEVTSGIPIIPCEDITLTLDGSGTAVYAPSFSAPSTLVIVGGDNQSNNSGTTTMQVSITENVNISFDWLFESGDSAGWDDLGYTLNGSFTNLSNGASYPANGNSAIVLNIGDVFEFTVNTDDNTFGAGTGTITNFLPGFTGQFDSGNWTEVITNSDGSTNFSGISSTISNDCGNPINITISQTIFTCQDIGENIITISADNGFEIGTCDATVTIVGTTSTFAAGSWDVTPNSGSKALFSDSYDTSSDGNVTACSCEIETGNTVTVNAGGYMSIEGNILVDGTLEVDHEGSLVQIDDLASVTKGGSGSITVEKITISSLTDRDFTILGSPMSAETRGGVYSSAFIVRHHLTGNFTPHPLVEAENPFAGNWADDNGDNWQTHTGALTVGEGYLVKPYAIGGGSGAYATTYTQGTLNNGVVNFTTVFGDDQNDSPNILSNPYASAVDAFVFVTDNDIVDAIYYWEHIMAPNGSYPGYNSQNYDMGDISMYNLTGGMSAPNEQGGAPVAKPSNQFIPSGQGFGVKAFNAGTGSTVTFNNSMRLTGNNTNYRNSEAIDRLYLSIANNTYGLKSGTLIGFTEGATDGYDRNYDAKRLATPVSLYSLNEDRELGIQGRSAFNEDQIIPLGFSTQVEENQEYTISISSLEGEQISQATVYLKDNLLNTQTNLSETDYTFIANAGHQTGRFIIVFVEDILGTNDLGVEAISLYPNPTQSIINIVSPQAEIISIEVYDVRGRLINNETINYQRTYQLDMSILESAMYFITINTEFGSITKRVVKE